METRKISLPFYLKILHLLVITADLSSYGVQFIKIIFDKPMNTLKYQLHMLLILKYIS